MALSSPGVQVTIIDQSQYLPAASSSVPLLVIATAQNKINAAGTGVASATTAANANKLYQVTSQRDLTTLYGNPFFYKTTTGTSIHGYELNEYGLMAAYSLLSSTNRAYVLRADVDLASLVGKLSRPLGEPADGTYWLDTVNTSWGIYEFQRDFDINDATIGKFVNKTPIVIAETTQVSNGYPLDSIGNIGDYAVIAYQIMGSDASNGTYFYKGIGNMWTKLGASDWANAVPTVKGTISSPSVPSGSFNIQINGGTTFEVSIPSSTSAQGVATIIGDLGITGLSANVVNGQLAIYLDHTILGGTNNNLFISAGTGTPLNALGIKAGVLYYAPEVAFGTSAQMPLWTKDQSYPHHTGSVWIKTSTAGAGVDINLNEYSTATAAWVSQNVAKYNSDENATYSLDSSGGKTIPAGTIYAQYSNTGTVVPNTVIKLWKRLVTGPTVVTGTTISPVVPLNKTVTVAVSIPGTTSLSNPYYVSTSGGATATDFVQAWQAQNIPYTTAVVTTDNAVQLTHTSGGQIYLTDFHNSNDGNGYVSGGVLSALGIMADETSGVKYDLSDAPQVTVSADDTNGSGLNVGNLSIQVIQSGNSYIIKGISHAGVGTPTGYSVGDTITVNGQQLGGSTGVNDLVVQVLAVDGSGIPTSVAYDSGFSVNLHGIILSNWVELDYIANEGAPATLPLNGTNWFYSTATQVDILVQRGGHWVSYGNVNFDSTGHPISGAGSTNPTGPILASSAPTTQVDGTALVYGDLWLNTGDLENYPVLSRWQLVDGLAQWVLIDNTDQTSHSGVLFADARWADSGMVDPVSDPITSITTLLTAIATDNTGTPYADQRAYVDADCPDPALYPQGMLLFNTRRSGYNVKQFKTNYFTSAKFGTSSAFNVSHPKQFGTLPEFSYAWVSVSGLKDDGSAYMGRKAQRHMVVKALKAAISTNMTIREEDTYFNLIAAPNYPELQPDMVSLNNDRNNTAYIIGDTPLRLPDQATQLTNWATNTAGATSSGEDGWVTRDSYLGVFYPSGITTDLTGSSIVVPASHMMLRTFLRNDTIAYPWLAAAGTRRGLIDNATNIGYLDATTGEFQTIKNRMGIRDVLYTNQINPLAYFTGVGLLNYGNKNSFDSQSALDRTNVARLIAYIRDRVQIAARPFVFEPNDALTRSQLAGVIQSLFVDLVAKRGLYDYLVVCDETNNTPARIDRNELWVDIAIEPVKAAEFIYIPVRVLNTGELSASK